MTNDTCIIAETAAMTFVPWVDGPDVWKPASNDEWLEAVNPHLVTARLAYGTMLKTKAELVESFEQLAEDGDDLVMRLVDQMQASRAWFEAYAALFDNAVKRTIVALAVMAEKQGQAD